MLLARNGQERYVAVKVLTAAATRADSGDVAMYDRFHDIRAKSHGNLPKHPGFRHCVEPLAVVTMESRHGLHRCIITPPYGSTVDDIQVAQEGERFSLPVVKNFVRQTLLALDFLHSEMDLVHAGTSVH